MGGRHIAEVTVPKEAPPGVVTLKWEVYELSGPTIDRRTAEPPPTETPGPGTVLADGSVEFTVRGVHASADHTEVAAGHTVGVTFRAVGADVTIGACGVDKPMAAACPEGSLPAKEVRVRVPPEAAPGDLVRLHWNADSGPDDVRHPDEGEIEIRIPQPPPNPEFDVRGQADELGPGQEYVATFRSLTPGVTIAGCGITLGAREACGAAGIAVVRVPSDTPSGTTLSIPWDLKYASRRPGEQHDTTTGTLVLRVRAEASEMKVTVQPATAHPGQEVVLTFVSLRLRTPIEGCVAFFPGQIPGAFCQQSTKRWYARLRVPADARPGPSLLRWGVESRTSRGDRVVDTGSFVFAVKARPPTEPPEDPDEPSRREPETDPTNRGTQSTTGSGSETPTFTAMSDPETAAPGERVTVSLTPVTPDVTVTGCAARFRGTSGPTCRLTGDRTGIAVLTVPKTTRAGDQPLDWDVTWRDATGRSGRYASTIAYRVSDPDTPAEPQFLADVAPPRAKAGEDVTVAPTAVDDDVTITGCRAEFGAGGGGAAECRETPQGWMAVVTVPQNAPGGTGSVLWNVAYEGAAPGTADGFSRLEVLPVADPGFWSKVAGFGGRIALGLTALAGFVAYRSFAGRIRERFKPGRDELPAGARVVVAAGSEAFRTDLSAPAREPRPAIRLVPAPGIPRLTLHEELP